MNRKVNCTQQRVYTTCKYRAIHRANILTIQRPPTKVYNLHACTHIMLIEPLTSSRTDEAKLFSPHTSLGPRPSRPPLPSSRPTDSIPSLLCSLESCRWGVKLGVERLLKRPSSRYLCCLIREWVEGRWPKLPHRCCCCSGKETGFFCLGACGVLEKLVWEEDADEGSFLSLWDTGLFPFMCEEFKMYEPLE